MAQMGVVGHRYDDRWDRLERPRWSAGEIPTMRSPLAKDRNDRSRGAVIVLSSDAAIVLPLLLALLGGFIDFAWVFNDLQTTRQEAREITRQAVVGVTSATSTAAAMGPARSTTSLPAWSAKSRTESVPTQW